MNLNQFSYEKERQLTDQSWYLDRKSQRQHQQDGRFATGVLYDGEKSRSCVYCQSDHWSDECTFYPDVECRRKKLTSCWYTCLKRGHRMKDGRIKRDCVYCKMKGAHHRSLCPKQFKKIQQNLSAGEQNLLLQGQQQQSKQAQNLLKVVESATVSNNLGKTVIMQTASVKVMNLNDGTLQQNIRLLLDCGSQRTYISKLIAEK